MNKHLNLKSLFISAFLLVGFIFLGQAFILSAVDSAYFSNISSRSGTRENANLEPSLVDSGAILEWQLVSSLPNRLYRHSSVYKDGYVYVLGGAAGWGYDGAITSSVLYAPVSAGGGKIGTWKYTSPIPGPANFDGRAFETNGYVYVVGGSEQVNLSTSSVWYSKINSDRSLSPWIETTPLPSARSTHALAFGDGYVYVLGGRKFTSEHAATSTVYYAKTNSNGTLGDWIRTAELPLPLVGHSAIYHNGYVYILGGSNEYNFSLDLVFAAKVLSGGSLGEWESVTPLPLKRTSALVLTAGDYLYFFGGGTTGLSATKEIFFAIPNSRGQIWEWNKSFSMPVAVGKASGFTAGDKVFIIGGITDTTPSTHLSSVLRATLDIGNVIEL